jgi:hypothetical protein
MSLSRESACIAHFDGQAVDARERFELFRDVGKRQHRFQLRGPLIVQIQSFIVYGERLAIPDIKIKMRHLRRPAGVVTSLRFPGQPFSFESLSICVEGVFCFFVLRRLVLRGLLEQIVRLIPCTRLGVLSHWLSSLCLW